MSKLRSTATGLNKVTKDVIYIANAYSTAKQIYNDVKARLDTRDSYSVSIAVTDGIAWMIRSRLTPLIVQKSKSKSLSSSKTGFVRSFRQGDTLIANIDGVRVRVSVQSEDTSSKNDIDRDYSYSLSPAYYVFVCDSLEGQQKVIAWLDKIRVEKYQENKNPTVYTANSWNDWSAFDSVPKRSIESVHLKEGQRDALVTDIQTFFDSEEAYTQNGVPYHRGYLLHGPPGTGKTSLIIALAQYFNKNVCFMSMDAIKSPTGIIDLFGYVPEDSFLLLEDVDVSHAVKDRDSTTPNAERTSFSTMLNALDGLTTPHGLVVFMTTNKLEAIDQAIIRPGRIDRVEHLGFVDTYQLNSMVSQFVDGNTDKQYIHEDISDLCITPAEISEVIKVYLTSSRKHDVLIGIKQLIDSKKEYHGNQKEAIA